MGRRAYSPATRRRNAVSIRLTDAEYDQLYHIAIKQDAEIAAWIRSVVLREVEKKEAT
jgi:hypothetical protein